MNKNHLALITGASSGIGKEIAYIHAQAGGDLVLVARRQDLLNTIKSDIESTYSVTVTTIIKDLSKPGAGEDLYQEIKKQNLSIDYLVNNAGYGGMGAFHERDWATDLAMIQLNIVALTTLTRLFLNDMVAQGRGRILNVSSTAGLTPGGPLQAIYFATKAFVTSFSNAIAEELNGSGISVTQLLPGPTETEFAKVANLTKTKLFAKTFSATKVARDGYHAMLKGKRSVISGIGFIDRIMLASTSYIPTTLVLKIIKSYHKSS